MFRHVTTVLSTLVLLWAGAVVVGFVATAHLYPERAGGSGAPASQGQVVAAAEGRGPSAPVAAVVTETPFLPAFDLFGFGLHISSDSSAPLASLLGPTPSPSASSTPQASIMVRSERSAQSGAGQGPATSGTQP